VKIINEVFKILGRDRTTRVRIRQRDDLVEVGSEYGGWVIPESLFDKDSVCYCVGCGEDITFDMGIIERFGCDVFAYDPTPRAVAHVQKTAGDNPKYHFSELGLWDKKETLKFYVPQNPGHVSHSLLNLQQTADYISVPVDRLSAVMQANGHDRIDLLKIDIEGAEYKVLESVVEDNLNIGVICVEYDECYHQLDQDYKSRIRNSVNRLIAAGYSLVCAQGNGNYTLVKNPTLARQAA